MNIVTGYEPADTDGERHLPEAIVIALEIGDDKSELEIIWNQEKDLREINESIRGPILWDRALRMTRVRKFGERMG